MVHNLKFNEISLSFDIRGFSLVIFILIKHEHLRMSDKGILLSFILYTIFYEAHCIVLLLIYLVPWRWLSTRAETSPQSINTENKI